MWQSGRRLWLTMLIMLNEYLFFRPICNSAIFGAREVVRRRVPRNESLLLQYG